MFVFLIEKLVCYGIKYILGVTWKYLLFYLYWNKILFCVAYIFCWCFQNVLIVFVQVCDEPHPLLIKDMLQHCVNGNIDQAYKVISHLWNMGYASEDIIKITFRVCKTHTMAEYLKLEFIKVNKHGWISIYWHKMNLSFFLFFFLWNSLTFIFCHYL